MEDFLTASLSKFGSVASAITVFFIVLGTIFFIAGKFNGKKARYIAIAIFQFLWVWNDLLVALTFAGGTEEVAPINAKLASLVGQYGSSWTTLTAGAFITISIPLVVFFSLQRYFVRGLTACSVK